MRHFAWKNYDIVVLFKLQVFALDAEGCLKLDMT